MCPVTTQTGQVGLYVGLGRGPAYPIGSHSLVTIKLPPPPEYGLEWGVTKRVWLVDYRYRDASSCVAGSSTATTRCGS